MTRHPSTSILVAGMHRSGTSATTGALARLGIALGPRLLAPGADNPKGYWENELAVAIHDELLAALGRRWDDVRALPDEWRASPAAGSAADAVRELVAQQFSEAEVWAVKDPRICRLLPVWLDTLPSLGVRTVVLFVARHPDEVAASIHVRNGWGREIGVLLWLRHVLEAEAASRGERRAVVAYDELIADPVRAIGNVLDRLDVVPPTPVAEAAGALQGFIEAGDRHHHAESGTARDMGPFRAIAHAAYDTLLRIAAGGDAWGEFDAHAAAFASAWSERAAELDALADMAGRFRDAEHAALGDALRFREELAALSEAMPKANARYDGACAARDRLRSDLIAQIRWSEEAAAQLESVRAERDRLRSDLTAQIRWSEEAAAQLESARAERDTFRSDLIAQIRWSEEAAAQLESARAERDTFRSDLTAQIRWSEEAAAQLESVRAERDTLRSDLTAQIRWSEEAAAQLESVRAERDTLRSDLTAQIRWSEEAAARLEAARADHEALALRLQALHADRDELAGTLDALRASRSWRLTRPLRAAARLVRPKPRD